MKDKFHKGEKVWIRIKKFDRDRGYNIYSGQYEIIRTGRIFYLFGDHNGHDLNINKDDLIAAIEAYRIYDK